MDILGAELWISLLTLSSLEVVLGIDNLIFIAILAQKLPIEQREKARRLGLILALVVRIFLLMGIGWIASFTKPIFSLFEIDFSGKSLLLLAGGLFLIYKATREIHDKMEGEEAQQTTAPKNGSFRSVILQILAIDLVFSVDSVITAVGLTQSVGVMIAANVIAMTFMLFSGRFIAHYVEKHPSIKILALSFLVMIGFILVAEGFGAHIPKGYAYFAMGFSIAVELINIRAMRSKKMASTHLLNSPKLPEGT